jgi:GTP:adenosylcobinamide-phosphate guanylyltransferase
LSVATLVLAGGRIKDRDAEAWKPFLTTGVDNRALLDLNGTTMLERVIAPVRIAAPGRIFVAGDVPLPEGCLSAPGGETLLDTLLNGVAALDQSETRLLVVTADIPFLTVEAISDVLTRSPQDAAFVYPIVEASRCYERFPEMKRTVVKTAQGTFTGGNLVLIDAAFAREKANVIRAAYAARKSPVKLAGMLGLGTLGRLIVSSMVPAALPISYLEAAVGRLLGGVQVSALNTPFPEIGADIDRPEDVPLARRLLG